MHAYSERVRRLINDLRLAFWNVSYPGDDRLLAEDSYDIDELGRLRCQEWNSHWSKVPNDAIEWHADSLGFLSPEAFCFYLPAFMIYSLEQPKSTAPVLPFLVYSLMDMADGERDCYQRRIALLSPKQKCAVLGFLKYVRDELKDAMCSSEANTAIEHYWGNCCRE